MATATLKRRQLGNELRHLRQRTGLNTEAAGELIGRSQSVMSRIECGETGIEPDDLRRLLARYAKLLGENIDYDWFAELNHNADQRGRWNGFRAIYKNYFRLAVDLEADATMMQIYQTEIVHGLLQTEEYMRALFAMNPVRTDEQSTERAIRARLDRQRVLDKPDAPQVTVVLSESGLRRRIGDAAIMHNQLRHLAELARQPNLHLHVLPFDAPVLVDVAYPFVEYRVPTVSNTGPPLEFVFEETFTNGTYIDHPDGVATYNLLWSGLLGEALDAVQSRAFLVQLAQHY